MSIIISSQACLLPLFKRVSDLGLIAMQQPFQKILNDADIPCKNIGDFVDDPMREAAIHEAVRLITKLSTTELDTIGLTPAVSNWLDDNLPAHVYQRVGEMALAVQALDRAQPKLVIVHNDVEPLLRLLALWAKSRGVPCLHIPHAVYIDNDGRGPAGTDIHDLITASDIIASGPYQAAWYQERGMSERYIHTTGLPQHDVLSNLNLSHEVACKLFHFTPQRPVIMYFSSWRQDTSLLGCHDGVEESYEAFLDAMHELPELQVIIKCHYHSDNVQYHIDKAKAKNVPCTITKDHLEVAMTAADMVITYGPSNVLLEAAALGGRSLLMIGDKTAFANDPEIRRCNPISSEIVDQIKQSLAAPIPYVSNITRKYMVGPDGKATERAEAIVRTLHK
jgi:hypothetical protein